MALDTLHVLRTSKPLPRQKVRVLAAVLDFAACANAALDHKGFCPKEYQAARQWLNNAGVAAPVEEYLRQLQELERRRPAPGGDQRRFDEVRSYREAVARLSLGAVAAIALGQESVEDGIRATYGDQDLATLFRIVMLCQIIDDVLDYREDVSAGLPSFLTASASLPQAIHWTAATAQNYAAPGDSRQSASTFPLRLALRAVSLLATLVIRAHQWLPHSRKAATGACSPAAAQD
jgi:hypothetical protein